MIPVDDAMKRISALAASLVKASNKVAKLTDELAAAKKEVLRIEREDLPELMRELELSSITLQDGSTIDVNDDFDCTITEANKEAALNWLKTNGFGGIIKTSVFAEFGKDEGDQAERFRLSAQSLINDHDVMIKEGVHPGTLKAFIREQREQGKNVPAKLFSIHPYSKANYKQKRSR